MTKKLKKNLASLPVDQMIDSAMSQALYNFVSAAENTIPFTESDLEGLQEFYYKKVQEYCDRKLV